MYNVTWCYSACICQTFEEKYTVKCGTLQCIHSVELDDNFNLLMLK